MQAQRTNGFVISITLHALIAALVFFTTYFVAKQTKEAPKIFELVAGPPTDIYSREAPKKGNTSVSIKIDIPDPVEDFGEPEESIPVAEPVPVVTPPVPVVKTPAVTPTPKPTPTPTPKPAEKPKVETKPKAPTTTPKVSYQDFLKNNPKVSKAPTTTSTASKPGKTTYKKIDVTGIAGGVAGGSVNSTGGGGGKALTRDEADKLDTYISFLMQEIRRIVAEDTAGLSDQLLAKVNFQVSASGAISNPKIALSSGNREFDNYALNVFRRLRSIGPTPDRKSHSWTVNFTMRPD